MSNKTTANKIEKNKKAKKSQERDKSPSVSDIRKIFQVQSVEKTDKQKIKGKQKDMQRQGNASGGTITRQQKKASAETVNTPTKSNATQAVQNGTENEHDEVFTDNEVEQEIVFKEPTAQLSTTELKEKESKRIEALNSREGAEAEQQTINSLSEQQEQSNHDNTKTNVKTAATQTDHDQLQLKMKVDLEDLAKKVIKLDESIFDPKNGVEVLLAKNIQKTSDIHSEIFGATEGLKVKLGQLQKDMHNTASKMVELENANKTLQQLLQDSQRLAQDLTVMQGIMQKHNQQLSVSKNKMLDLTKRGMEQNLIIYGIEDPEEI